MIPLSAEFEKELAAISDEESKKAFLAESKSALNDVIKNGFNTLGLEYFFTAGEKETKCWIIRKGSKAPKAAGRIHSDFEKTFLKVELSKYTDLVELGSEKAVKAAGKYMIKGKDYVVVDGDVVLFKFAGAKK